MTDPPTVTTFAGPADEAVKWYNGTSRMKYQITDAEGRFVILNRQQAAVVGELLEEVTPGPEVIWDGQDVDQEPGPPCPWCQRPVNASPGPDCRNVDYNGATMHVTHASDPR